MATLPQLFEEDIRVLDTALENLLVRSEATVIMLIDKAGFLIAKRGSADQIDATTLAALAAGSYAATETIASLVGETNFSSIYQQGDHFSLLVQNVDEYCLLSVVFRANISVGMVKFYAVDTTRQIADQLKSAQERDPNAGLDLSAMDVSDTSLVFRKKPA
jgi:predicted regulator of Ras-like GTPase activity (Roadblock/LC7/MglB family)